MERSQETREYVAIVKLAKVTGYREFKKIIHQYEGKLKIREKFEVNEVFLFIKGEESEVEDAIAKASEKSRFTPSSKFGIYGYGLQPDESFTEL
jgi:hypothetical protein